MDVEHYSPAAGKVPWIRVITPYISYLGPARFRRFLLDLVPLRNVQNIKYIIDTLHERSKEIYHAKKAAVEKGDTDLLNAVGEGKDIMSVLRKLPSNIMLLQ